MVPVGGDLNGFAGVIEPAAGEFTGPFEAKADSWALCVLVEFEVFIQALDAWEEWGEIIARRAEYHPRPCLAYPHPLA